MKKLIMLLLLPGSLQDWPVRKIWTVLQANGLRMTVWSNPAFVANRALEDILMITQKIKQ